MSDTSNIDTHRQTYEKVMAWLKWGAIISFALTGFVVWLIAG